MVLGQAQTTVVFVQHSAVAVHHVASRLPYRLVRRRRSNEGDAGRTGRISVNAAACRCTLIACITSACARRPASGNDEQRNDRCPISKVSREEEGTWQWSFGTREDLERRVSPAGMTRRGRLERRAVSPMTLRGRRRHLALGSEGLRGEAWGLGNKTHGLVSVGVAAV
jgi:hypothetical protein